MVSLILKLVKIPILRYFFIAVLIIISVGIYGKIQYNLGYDKRDIDYKIAAEKENKRINEANRIVLEESKKIIKDLEKTVEKRNAQLRDIIKKADSDPNSDRISLGVDSVFRLNKIH